MANPSDKMFPAAVHADQEMLANEEDKPIVLAAPAFSSNHPETDAQRMLPLEDGTSAYEAREPAAEASEMKAADFKARVEAATTQDELDEVAELYAASGKDYSTVEAAVEAKQEELDSSDQS